MCACRAGREVPCFNCPVSSASNRIAAISSRSLIAYHYHCLSVLCLLVLANNCNVACSDLVIMMLRLHVIRGSALTMAPSLFAVVLCTLLLVVSHHRASTATDSIIGHVCGTSLDVAMTPAAPGRRATLLSMSVPTRSSHSTITLIALIDHW